MVHGDGFVALGGWRDVRWLDETLKCAFKTTSTIIGLEGGDAREVNVLSRVIRYTEAGFEYEADTRRAELIVDDVVCGKA